MTNLAGIDLNKVDLEASTAVSERDAGNEAATRVRLRHAAYIAKKALVRTLGLAVLLAVVAGAAVAYYGYTTQVKGYVADDRQCKLTIGDYELTGTRTYSYPFHEYFGYRFIDTTSIEEKTRIDVNGTPIQIVGLIGDEHWVINVGMGEKGKQLLKPADTYVFMVGKSPVPAKYKSFCK